MSMKFYLLDFVLTGVEAGICLKEKRENIFCNNNPSYYKEGCKGIAMNFDADLRNKIKFKI